MPNSPSAIKRLKQSVKRRLRNRIAKKLIKTYWKRALASAAVAGQVEKATADFRATIARIDKAGRPPHPPSEHRRPPQEPPDPRVPGGPGQGQGLSPAMD